MANNYVQDITDVAARVADLSYYRFIGNGATRTITGYFVDNNNQQTGTAFSGTVGAGDGTVTAVSFADLNGAAVPADAVGAVCTFSGSTYMGLGTSTALVNDIKTNYARYPSVPATTMRGVGRVA